MEGSEAIPDPEEMGGGKEEAIPGPEEMGRGHIPDPEDIWRGQRDSSISPTIAGPRDSITAFEATTEGGTTSDHVRKYVEGI